MTHPDLQGIPTLDDLVFPGDHALKSNGTNNQEPPVAGSTTVMATGSGQIPFTETIHKDKQQTPQIHAGDSLLPSFDTGRSAAPHQGQSNNEALTTDVIPHRQEPIFQFGTEMLSIFHRNEPSFGPIVSIHTLAAEEARTNLVTPGLLATSPDQGTREEPHFPDGMNSEGLIPADRTLDSPTAVQNEHISHSQESFEILVAAAVRRAMEDELPQLNQRIIDRILRELGQGLR